MPETKGITIALKIQSQSTITQSDMKGRYSSKNI